MLQLLHALPTLYPCSHGTEDLGGAHEASPSDVRNRAALGVWLCETHNEVNALLGKPVFDCARVDDRWRDGPEDASCDRRFWDNRRFSVIFHLPLTTRSVQHNNSIEAIFPPLSALFVVSKNWVNVGLMKMSY
jgi:hypothetical protein